MNIASLVAGVTFIVTLAFHFLLAEHFHGIPLLVVSALLIGGILLVRSRLAFPKNRWSAIFLFPWACAAFASLMYTDGVILFFAPLVVFTSVALFGFWTFMGHQIFVRVETFIPPIFARALFFPFPSLSRYVRNIGKIPHGARIVTGVGISVPFVIIFAALFTSADPLFQRAVSDVFGDVLSSSMVGRLLRDVIFGSYVLAVAWLGVERVQQQELPTQGHEITFVSSGILGGFLATINSLFLVFICFQAAYFFGGESIVRRYDLTYAEYARGGFFQLLVVAGIVLGLSYVLYVRTTKQQRVVHWMMLALILQTGVVLASAFRRLGLYIDVYGLTVARWWAYAGLFVVGVLLVVMVINIFASWPHRIGRSIVFLTALCLPSLLLTVNVESIVARRNIEHWATGNAALTDVVYLTSGLGDDALPDLIQARRVLTPETFLKMFSRIKLRRDEELEKAPVDWRDIRFSQVWASMALQGMD